MVSVWLCNQKQHERTRCSITEVDLSHTWPCSGLEGSQGVVGARDRLRFAKTNTPSQLAAGVHTQRRSRGSHVDLCADNKTMLIRNTKLLQTLEGNVDLCVYTSAVH